MEWQFCAKISYSTVNRAKEQDYVLLLTVMDILFYVARKEYLKCKGEAGKHFVLLTFKNVLQNIFSILLGLGVSTTRPCFTTRPICFPIFIYLLFTCTELQKTPGLNIVLTPVIPIIYSCKTFLCRLSTPTGSPRQRTLQHFQH